GARGGARRRGGRGAVAAPPWFPGAGVGGVAPPARVRPGCHRRRARPAHPSGRGTRATPPAAPRRGGAGAAAPPAPAARPGRAALMPAMRTQGARLEQVQRVLAGLPEHPTSPEVVRVIREQAGVISDEEVIAVLRRLRSESVGIGPLEGALALPGVTDVLVNG